MNKYNEDYYSYIKKLYGRVAPFYDVITLFIFGIRKKVVEITNAKNSSKILDVCTGTGSQALAFGKIGCDVVGIDLSDNMLKVANKKKINMIMSNSRMQMQQTCRLMTITSVFHAFLLHCMICP